MTDETKAPAEEKADKSEEQKEKKEETASSAEKTVEFPEGSAVVENVSKQAVVVPAPEDEAEAEVEVPAKFTGLVEQVENMSVIELNELVKVLEKKFGVSAAAVAVAGAGPTAGGDAEEKDEFDVELTTVGEAKIQVIKAVKEVLGLGLKEAKDLVDGAPSMLKEGMKKEEAEVLKAKVEEAGGKVTLK